MRSEHEFFSEICDSLLGACDVLVAGSHAAQTDFHHFVDSYRPGVARRVVDWQTLDQPIANEMVALARRYFASHPATRSSDGKARLAASLEFA